MKKLLVLTLTASLLTLQGIGCFVNGEAFAQAQKAYVSAYNKEGVCTVKLAKYKGLNAAIDTAENYEKRANEFIGYLIFRHLNILSIVVSNDFTFLQQIW